jgi:peptidoglycan hydrolase CwlO-like protein
MKKLIALVSGVLISSMSFSQAVTKTASDSVVVMNKKLVQYMIQDLIRYDADKQALNLLDSNLRMKDAYILGQQNLLESQERRMKSMSDLLISYETTESEQTRAIEDLKADLRKQRTRTRVYQVGTVGAIIGAVLVHYSWKYVGK